MYAIAREKGMDEKLIKLVVHEDIHYISYKKTGTISLKGDTGKVSEAHQEKHPLEQDMLWFLPDENKFCQHQISSQNNRFCLTQRCAQSHAEVSSNKHGLWCHQQQK